MYKKYFNPSESYLDMQKISKIRMKMLILAVVFEILFYPSLLLDLVPQAFGVNDTKDIAIIPKNKITIPADSEQQDTVKKQDSSILLNATQYKPKFIDIRINAYGDDISLNSDIARTMCLNVNYQAKGDYDRCRVSHTTDYQRQINDFRDAKYEIIITQSTIQQDVLNRADEFQKYKKYEKLRFLFSLQTVPVIVITKKISDIQTINALEGKKIDIGQNYSSKKLFSEWMRHTKKDPRSFFSQVSQSDTQTQTLALCNDQVAAVVLSEEQPSPIITKIATLCDVDMMGFSNFENFLESHGEYVKTQITGGDYLGTPFTIETSGPKITVLSSSDVDETTIYQFTKLILENIDTLRQLHPSLNDITLDSMLNEGRIAPFHDGVLKYLREINYDMEKLKIKIFSLHTEKSSIK